MSNTISLTPTPETIVLVEHPEGRLEVHLYVGLAPIIVWRGGDGIGILSGERMQLKLNDQARHVADELGVPLFEFHSYVVKLLRLAGVEASL